MRAPARSVVDILNLLPKTNCRECGAPTCMAFAVAALQGKRPLSDCPYVQDEVSVQVRSAAGEPAAEVGSDDREDAFHEAIERIASSDLGEAAKRLGLEMRGDRVMVPVLIRRFEIGPTGALHSDCHINPWVHLPILRYLLDGAGKPLSGRWVPFTELRGSTDWVRFFSHRCERGMELLANEDPDLFFDTLDLFGGSRGLDELEPELLEADLIARLEPLPGVALLFRYWRPEEEFEAKLSLLFDSASGENLDARAIYYLTQGLLEMFKRVVQRHGTIEGWPHSSS